MIVGEYLEREEVAELPVGAHVEVVWSGGNGPHEYRIIEHRGGLSCVDNIYRDPLDFVGLESPFTTVKLLALPPPCGSA